MTALVWGSWTLPAGAAASYYLISGTVFDEKGNPTSGTRIVFSDGPVIQAEPSFSRQVNGGGVVYVKPEKDGFRFQFHFRSHSFAPDGWVPAEGLKVGPLDLSGNIPVVDLRFYAYPEAPKYNLSGRVTSEDGRGIPGVTIHFGDGKVVPADPTQAGGNITPSMTDDFGNWAKNDLSGSVTVMPAMTGYTFAPPYMLAGSASAMMNFIGTVQAMIIKVNVNGLQLDFDQKPAMRNGRVLVPLRKIFEALNAKISWDDKTQTATATRGGTTVSVTIGSVDAYVNGKLVKLDQPPMAVNGRTLVPVRFISEAFGAEVKWDGENSKVQIVSKERLSPSKEAVAAYLQGLKEQDPAKIIAYMDQAINLAPDFFVAYFTRGSEFQKLGQDDKAMEDLNQAILLDPSFGRAYGVRGDVYVKLNQYDKALADFAKAIELNLSPAKAHSSRGLLYITLNQPEKALADLDKAVKLEPYSQMPLIRRATGYFLLKQTDKAVADIQKALQVEPDNPDNAGLKLHLRKLGVPGY
ncbi:MAG TPA: stalk domain-containing protein [Bacillota bacterium]